MAEWSAGESIRIEALQVQHTQLREKLNAARWQLSACARARDNASLEHATAAEEAIELESKASVVRQEVAACGEQLRALKNGGSAHTMETNPFPLARSLVDKRAGLERSIQHFEEETHRIRCQSKNECMRAKQEESELEAEANSEKERMMKQIRQCEQEKNTCERSQHELQQEYAERGEVLRLEMDAAELDAWREVLGAQKYEQQAESQLEQIATERSRLQSVLEESRLSAADATCLRARLRRVMKDVETRSVVSSSEMQTAHRVFKVLSDERSAVEKRLGVAETELASMLSNMLSEEKRWDAEMDQVCQHRKMLDASLRKGLEKQEFLRDAALREEFEELQSARFHLSQVEARSCAAQQGLSEALSRLTASQGMSSSSSTPQQGLSEALSRLAASQGISSSSHNTASLHEVPPFPSSTQTYTDDIRDLLDKTQKAMERSQDHTQLWLASSPSTTAALTPTTLNRGAPVFRRPLSSTLQQPQNV